MPTNRTTIKRGPAKITFGGITLVPQGEAKLDLQYDTFDVQTSTLPDADERVSNVENRLSFTPDGTVSQAILDVLYACAGYVQGQSILTEGNLVVTFKTDGETITFPSWGIIKPPELMLSAVKTPFGETEIVLPGKNNTAWTDAAKRLTVGSATYTEAASPGDIITETPTLAWGDASPWNALSVAEGLKVGFDLKTTPDSTDDEGILDYVFEGLKANATFTPKNITTAQLITALKLQGTGARRGASLNSKSLGDLIASNSGLYFMLYGAALKQGPMAAGPTTNRLGELNLINTKSDGTTPVFYIGTDAPA